MFLGILRKKTNLMYLSDKTFLHHVNAFLLHANSVNQEVSPGMISRQKNSAMSVVFPLVCRTLRKTFDAVYQPAPLMHLNIKVKR